MEVTAGGRSGRCGNTRSTKICALQMREVLGQPGAGGDGDPGGVTGEASGDGEVVLGLLEQAFFQLACQRCPHLASGPGSSTRRQLTSLSPITATTVSAWGRAAGALRAFGGDAAAVALSSQSN